MNNNFKKVSAFKLKNKPTNHPENYFFFFFFKNVLIDFQFLGPAGRAPVANETEGGVAMV